MCRNFLKYTKNFGNTLKKSFINQNRYSLTIEKTITIIISETNFSSEWSAGKNEYFRGNPSSYQKWPPSTSEITYLLKRRRKCPKYTKKSFIFVDLLLKTCRVKAFCRIWWLIMPEDNKGGANLAHKGSFWKIFAIYIASYIYRHVFWTNKARSSGNYQLLPFFFALFYHFLAPFSLLRQLLLRGNFILAEKHWLFLLFCRLYLRKFI